MIQTCALVSNFLRENRDNPLAEMKAYRERLDRVKQLSGGIGAKVLEQVHAVFTDFE
jgi:hypothetical protein